MITQRNSATKRAKFASLALSASLLALTAGTYGTSAQAAGQSMAQAPAAMTEVTVGAGKTQVIELPGPYTDAMIGDPKIADILPLNAHSVYVVGKAQGATSLTLYGPGKHLIAAVNVVVSADLEGLKARLNQILPGETDIAVSASNQSIVLSGTVGSPTALSQVLALADSYAPGKVINMLGVEGTQQVMLSVRFVEMERTTAKDLQLNLQNTSARPGSITLNTGDTINNNTNLLTNLFGTAVAHFGPRGGGLDALFDALETKGLVKTLAEPNLVAMSGDTASFLAGGEFPIPVQQTSGASGIAPTITVQFKQFGVALSFTPTLLKDGLINLIVNPEVSEIDPSTSFELGQIRIPGIKVRRARTTVELRDGESFTVAGLLQEKYTDQIRQYPFVGDLPVLGALFRSSGYQRDETELVIVVTPHLVMPHRGPTATPSDRFVPPSDFELFLFGALQSSGLGLRPEDRALLTADPSAGGVDGPHGHVLY